MSIHIDNSHSETGDRNPSEYLVLGALAMQSAHGYDVYSLLQRRLGQVWRLGRSQLYALLSRLERDGLVTHQRVDQENLPPKKIFYLTEAGRELFTAWATSPVNSIRDLRMEFLAKLYFSREISAKAGNELLEKQLAVCRQKAEHLEALKGACTSQIERMALDYRLTVVEASISWLERLL